jgi:glutamine amidotransferase
MEVAVVKYNAGNLHSVTTALSRLGASFVVSDVPAELQAAPRVIFPGVGEASSAMRDLRERALDTVIRELKQPVLGLCLGQHLMCRHSEENDATCLNVVDLSVRRFTLPRKVPHMGWSKVRFRPHPLFEGIEEGAHFYFVHSYRVDLGPATVATCSYEEEFSAAIAHRNFAGVQFHPEKSSEAGRRLLGNFLRWNP